MLHFARRFYGCRQGDIYPTWFEVGDECPPELEAAAIDCGAVEPAEPGKDPNATRKYRRSAKALPG